MRVDNIAALRTPLIAFALTLVLGAGAIIYSGSLSSKARHILALAEMQLRNERVRIHDAAEEKATIARHLSAYEALAQAGLAGDEQRMNWLDGLRFANLQARTFGMEYDIGAQRPYTYAAELNPGPLRISESVMQVRLRLLHEEDLSRFFDALSHTGSGFFTVDRCVLRRPLGRESDQAEHDRENVLAECDLRWLTVRAAGRSDKK